MPQERLVKMKNYQKINHFPSMYQICRKNLLAKNLKRMERIFGNEYMFSPPTWVLPHDIVELKNYIEKKKTLSMIVKPESSSQGKGIFITKKLEDINVAEH
jgi:tubulin polyglutamylase TTLL6/13